MLAAQAGEWAERCDQLRGWADVMWDPRGSAGSYATFAALLAGFSVSGLLWISGGEQAARLSKSIGVTGIWASLVPLILAVLLFGENEGEQLCGRAMVNTAVASTLLTIGTVSVILSLTHLLGDLFDATMESLSLWVAWIAIVLGGISTFLGNDTLMVAFQGDRWEFSNGWVAQVLALLAAFAIGLIWRPQWNGGSAYVATILGAVGFVTFYIPAFLEEEGDWIPAAVAWARLGVWCCFSIAAIGELVTRRTAGGPDLASQQDNEARQAVNED